MNLNSLKFKTSFNNKTLNEVKRHDGNCEKLFAIYVSVKKFCSE